MSTRKSRNGGSNVKRSQDQLDEPRMILVSQSSGIRDWLQVVATGLPGVAAVVALVFAALSVQANNTQLSETRQQLDISQQGQITDRFNAAVSNLASANPVIQLGGIYALQRIMYDSPRDQPSVVELLSAYIRNHAPLSLAKETEVIANPSHMTSDPVLSLDPPMILKAGRRSPRSSPVFPSQEAALTRCDRKQRRSGR